MKSSKTAIYNSPGGIEANIISQNYHLFSVNLIDFHCCTSLFELNRPKRVIYPNQIMLLCIPTVSLCRILDALQLYCASEDGPVALSSGVDCHCLHLHQWHWEDERGEFIRAQWANTVFFDPWNVVKDDLLFIGNV